MTNEAGSQLKRATGPDLWMTLAAAAVAILMIVAATQVQAQTYTVLHSFAGTHDGSYPEAGLTMDGAGNLYGTTAGGGTYGGGTVFKLTHQGSGWILKPLYEFTGRGDGGQPESRVVFGPDGSLYGTTFYGGNNDQGVVYKLQPPQSACKSAICPWTETVLYRFTGGSEGSGPMGDLTFDSAGNIYGTTNQGAGGSGFCYSGCGAVYELVHGQGGWSVNALHSFTGGSDGAEPANGVIFDSAGNLYGTAAGGGYEFYGVVFELTPGASGWNETVLHTFMGDEDGGNPRGGLTFDGSGNLYGTTQEGGGHENGTAFELQPANGGWNYSLLYNLGLESGQPNSTLAIDNAGNLYGTAFSGGTHNAGAVYELTFSGGSWNYVSLHDFLISDGEYPQSQVILDSQGNMYGTTGQGGANGVGVVFEIAP